MVIIKSQIAELVNNKESKLDSELNGLAEENDSENVSEIKYQLKCFTVIQTAKKDDNICLKIQIWLEGVNVQTAQKYYEEHEKNSLS